MSFGKDAALRRSANTMLPKPRQDRSSRLRREMPNELRRSRFFIAQPMIPPQTCTATRLAHVRRRQARAFEAYQKINLAPSWMTRGSPAAEILPNVGVLKVVPRAPGNP